MQAQHHSTTLAPPLYHPALHHFTPHSHHQLESWETTVVVVTQPPTGAPSPKPTMFMPTPKPSTAPTAKPTNTPTKAPALPGASDSGAMMVVVGIVVVVLFIGCAVGMYFMSKNKKVRSE